MIGYYIHHHGLGHRNRALAVAQFLRTPVIGFSSLTKPDDWPGDWCQLPDDRTPMPEAETANGALHWAPLNHPGHRIRMRMIAQQLALDVSTLVVDTSAEVALLGRLFGRRVALSAMRGDRRDRAHTIAYQAADRILAPWTESTGERWWPNEWTEKTVFTGALSRFDACERVVAAARDATAARQVLVLWGAGGLTGPVDEVDAAQAATPGWRWTLRTPREPSPDLWRELCEADVVVTHGGQNAVAEVAAAARPAVVIAQDRPFGEQHATVAALRTAGIAVAVDSWPPPEHWPALLAEADQLGGDRWREWTHRDGAQRTAAAIESLEAERTAE